MPNQIAHEEPPPPSTISKKVVYYEKCPGCEVDKLKDAQKGMPYKDLFYLGFVVLCSALPISSIYPFLYFMIRDFHIAKKEEDIGFYSGFLGGSYMLGRTLSSVLWGMLADRYGRKPVILISIGTMVIFNTIFGLSTSFLMACSMRFLLGAFNGLLGTIKAYACEICTEKYQALAISVISTIWGVGLVIGPAVGGFLAQPADKYPTMFSKVSVFGRFPYFLPCLCISTFTLGVAIACCWLPETLHNHKGKTEEVDKSNLDDNTQDPEDEQAKSNSKPSLFKNWPLMSSIIIYCLFSLHDIAYSEIFSLWAVSPRKFGGLNFTTSELGRVLSFTGLGLILFQLILYPIVQRLVGHVTISRVAIFVTIPLLASYTFMSKLSGLRLTIILNFANILKNVLSSAVLTGLLILQNNAVAQNQRGTANGIAMTGMSLFSTFGPVAGGTLFSWSQTRMNSSFLPGTHMIFFILNLVGFVGLLMCFRPFLAFPRPDKLRG